MKKLLRIVKPMTLVTIVALAVLLTTVTATAASDKVYFDPSTCSAAYGNTVNVELRVNATDFQSGQMELTYDTGCCNVTNFVRNTTDFALGGWDSTTDGREWITFMNVVGPLTGDYLIGTLTVQCLTDGECTTNLVIANDDSELFNDAGGELTTVDWMNGEFSCENGGVSNEVYFDPSTCSAAYPNTVDVELKVNATNFQSGQMELTYDTGCCNVTNFVRNTADFALGGWDSTTDGREWITFSNTTGLLTGDYLIGTLTVQCLTDGECTTDLVIANDDSELFKDTGGELPSVNWMNGEFSCGLTTDPTLVSYTITNTTITPPQTTSIDVKFSEQVSAIIKIEDASGNLVNELYTSSGVTDPSEKIWDGTDTDGTTVPDDIYTVNVSGVSTATGRSVINTSRKITVTSEAQTLDSIVISPASCDLIVGGSRTFTAVCYNGSTVIDCPTLTWASSNETVGTITSEGAFTAAVAGTTTINTSAEGITSNAATVTVSPEIVRINSWDLPATGSRGTAIDATVNITNTGAETIWFVVSVAGTSTTGESIVGLGTIEVGAGATKDVYVKIPVPGDADAAGTYTLYPDVYTFDGYPSTLQATGSGDTIVIS